MVCGERTLIITAIYRCFNKQTCKINKFGHDVILFKKNLDNGCARFMATLRNLEPQMEVYSEVRLFYVKIKHQCEISHPQLGHYWWCTRFHHAT